MGRSLASNSITAVTSSTDSSDDSAQSAAATSATLRVLASALAAETAGGGGAILGIGVDVEEIASFEALPFDAHQHFYARVFTSDEIRYCLTYALPAEHFAARFAAKEAVVKACGNLGSLLPTQVEIQRLPTGAPLVRLHPTDALDSSIAVHVSLGHSQRLAYAVAVAVAVVRSADTVSQPDGSVP